MSKPTKEDIWALFEDDNEVKRLAVLAYIQDKSNSFEDRKEIWLNTPGHLQTHSGWVINLPKFEKKYGEISWYDDLNISKHETVDLTEIFDWGFFEDDGEEDGYDQKKMDLFIEACMDEGYHSFTFDW